MQNGKQFRELFLFDLKQITIFEVRIFPNEICITVFEDTENEQTEREQEKRTNWNAKDRYVVSSFFFVLFLVLVDKVNEFFSLFAISTDEKRVYPEVVGFSSSRRLSILLNDWLWHSRFFSISFCSCHHALKKTL